MTIAQCKAARRKIKNNPNYPNPSNFQKARRRDQILIEKQKAMMQRKGAKAK